MTLAEFCVAVDTAVTTDYGYDDGGDLCHNLVELGAIRQDEGIAMAAAIVAQHMEQA